MRRELLEFIDESIGKYKKFLGDISEKKQFYKNEKQREEQAIIDKRVEQGLAKVEEAKAISIAIKLKEMKLPIDDQIKIAIDLTADQINAI